MDLAKQYHYISVEQKDAVLWLTLDRADRLNAFTADMLDELRSVLSQLHHTPRIRCLVISGAGRAFGAGQDLADLDLDAVGDLVETQYNPLIRSLSTLHIPVIACVNGVAAGAAANMALACDIVLAARSARFIQPFNQIGLVPDAGGSWTLPRLIGLARATALCLTGEAVPAEKAEQWGMIWRCVEDETLLQEVADLAARLSNQATGSLFYTKQLLRLSQTRTLDEQLNLERDYQRAASQSADFREGVDAFLNKRPPRFHDS